MSVIEKIAARQAPIAVIGLGYVGLPIACAFSQKADVIGFDTDRQKIDLYRCGIDSTKEIGNEVLKQAPILFTAEVSKLKNVVFYIITVPTPINTDHTPDLTCILEASKIVGKSLTKGAIVVYESTVYPGCTESECIPILERESGLTCGVDFKVGYSPERINPGDKLHRFENICKVVSACDLEALNEIAQVYEMVVKAGVHPVSSIKTAEAIKVVENSQRDINIAFMNELAMVFDKMGIDTNEVVDGMNTKWNALGFRPGLVGGHCIGVDPYYFTYETEKLGYHSQIVLNGRIVNENMGYYIADAAINQLILAGYAPINANVAILGLTFKENCHDIRNSKVYDVVKRLNTYGIKPVVSDPWADYEETLSVYGIELSSMDIIKDMDCIIFAVAHEEYRSLSLSEIKQLYRTGNDSEKILIDVKGIFSVTDLKDSGMRWWRL